MVLYWCGEVFETLFWAKTARVEQKVTKRGDIILYVNKGVEMHRQRFGWKDDSCGCWDNNGGRGTSALSPSVWICQRSIDSYFECVRVNALKENKKKGVKARKRPTVPRKGHRGKSSTGWRCSGVEFGGNHSSHHDSPLWAEQRQWASAQRWGPADPAFSSW